MSATAQKQPKTAGNTCPNYRPDFSGYCQECYQKTDCMLMAILHKLESTSSK